MKITVLCENTAVSPGFEAEHGLSLFIETVNHKILFDMGQTDIFIRNAMRLGVELASADIAVLSHGHYDHGGGLMKFFEINNTAQVYISPNAFGEHYNASAKYIGLDKRIADSGRLVYVEDTTVIDDELTLEPCTGRAGVYPLEPFGLCVKRGGIMLAEDFCHEHYLTVNEAGRRVLFSGCSHRGILNISEWFKPDVLVGGFHLNKVPAEGDGSDALDDIAAKLMRYDTEYFTGHCTGAAQYDRLKLLMGDSLKSISSGCIFEI